MREAAHELAGYVLAGGRSSRMGRDKALLELNGRPLVAIAVERLKRLCSEVYLLGDRPDLKDYAPAIPDLHPDIGPMAGIEAALERSTLKWNLFMPVDMPFLSADLLEQWIVRVLEEEDCGARASMMSLDDTVYPMPCLLHRELRPLVSDAVARGRYRLFSAVKDSCGALSANRGLAEEKIFRTIPVEGLKPVPDIEEKRLWFVNVNTPEEFARAAVITGR